MKTSLNRGSDEGKETQWKACSFGSDNEMNKNTDEPGTWKVSSEVFVFGSAGLTGDI